MALNNLNIRTKLLIVGILNVAVFNFLFIDITSQLYVFGIIILLTGVPHGALDLFLDKQQRINEGLTFSKNLFLLKIQSKLEYHQKYVLQLLKEKTFDKSALHHILLILFYLFGKRHYRIRMQCNPH